MPRQARRKSESDIYHVMLRGNNRQIIFEDIEDRKKFLLVLNECKAVSEFKLFAYCLMDNHIHLLIQEGKEPLQQIMKRIEGRYVYWYNIKYQRIGNLFQDRYKSEPVENDEYFLTVLRYIHQNPINAGLAKSLSYPFSSYDDYFNKKSNSVVDISFALEMLSIQEFIHFHEKAENEKCMEIRDITTVRLTDEQAKRVLKEVSDCEYASQFQKLDLAQRDKYVKELKENGLSIRQISRLTGVSKAIIERIEM